MKFGLDRLLSDPVLSAPLKGRRVALVAHPASTTQDLTHAVDALAAHPDVRLSAAFGPQHGMKGDLQDNMMESPDYTDPVHGIPSCISLRLRPFVRETSVKIFPSESFLIFFQSSFGNRCKKFIVPFLHTP